ncbi:hypothetical protein HMPREF0454_03429 [Hafnia alvei ATCC 51873]|uniref:Uncharacterized protein n=1 Tax=Hafnia alvei ATCC 51873 TaxID=1002364 RepID=G9YA10_HAFAL|nr:hypothetical protein HMPREF0454_03429 [Hafnia alvei ATCC 51873]
MLFLKNGTLLAIFITPLAGVVGILNSHRHIKNAKLRYLRCVLPAVDGLVNLGSNPRTSNIPDG